jgi:hypothetical protein
LARRKAEKDAHKKDRERVSDGHRRWEGNPPEACSLPKNKRNKLLLPKVGMQTHREKPDIKKRQGKTSWSTSREREREKTRTWKLLVRRNTDCHPWLQILALLQYVSTVEASFIPQSTRNHSKHANKHLRKSDGWQASKQITMCRAEATAPAACHSSLYSVFGCLP